MDNGITTVTIHLTCDGGKDSFPYLCDSIIHDHVRSKWVFECRSPIYVYESQFEGFPPVAGVGGACGSTRKGKGGEGVPDLFDTMTTGGCLYSNWLDNLDSSSLSNKVIRRRTMQ